MWNRIHLFKWPFVQLRVSFAVSLDTSCGKPWHWKQFTCCVFLQGGGGWFTAQLFPHCLQVLTCCSYVPIPNMPHLADATTWQHSETAAGPNCSVVSRAVKNVAVRSFPLGIKQWNVSETFPWSLCKCRCYISKKKVWAYCNTDWSSHMQRQREDFRLAP